MLRLAALLTLAALIAPATAGAASGTAAGLFVGRTVFGMPACGQPHVETSTPEDYEAEHGTGVFDGEPEAWADEERCTIVINPRYKLRTAVKRCHVIVHEWGHLAGREHSENPRSVMYAEDLVAEGLERLGRGRSRWVAAGAFRPCYAAAAPGADFG